MPAAPAAGEASSCTAEGRAPARLPRNFVLAILQMLVYSIVVRRDTQHQQGSTQMNMQILGSLWEVVNPESKTLETEDESANEIPRENREAFEAALAIQRVWDECE
jgi:hypothetical protein